MSGTHESARKRITQMTNFILQEAHEKADEIHLKADEEFQIEKGRILNPEKIKLKQEFDRKFKELEVQRKIALSTQINKARLEVLEKRGQLMRQLQNETNSRLANLKKDKKKYKEIMKRLMIQAFIRMDETVVTIRVVEEDYELAKEVFNAAVEEYTQIWNSAIGGSDSIQTTLDDNTFLPPAHVGGVLLTARNGKIVLDNTLSARLKVGQSALLSAMRGQLFGIVPHVGVVYEEDDQKEDQ